MRLETSVEVVEDESNEPLGECVVARDTEEIAESIDDVLGICLPSGRREEPISGGETVALGEGGEELPKCLESGIGDDILRS